MGNIGEYIAAGTPPAASPQWGTMKKEITVNAPEGANVEIMQTISQPPDLEVGPVSVGDASVLTWGNAGIVIVILLAASVCARLYQVTSKKK